MTPLKYIKPRPLPVCPLCGFTRIEGDDHMTYLDYNDPLNDLPVWGCRVAMYVDFPSRRTTITSL